METNCNIEKFESIVKNLNHFFRRHEAELNGVSDKADLDSFMPFLISTVQESHDQMEALWLQSSNEDRNDFKKIYRSELNSYWEMGEITNRVINKPLGYHGDYIVMKLMYDNDYAGKNNIGKCLHKFVTENSSSASVRERRKHFKNRMKQLSDKNPEATLLSVACGPAIEISDSLMENCIFKRIVLLDQDKEALQFAKAKIESCNNSEVEIIDLNISIESVINAQDQSLSKYGPFDFIYSAGLYDYLPNVYAERLTANLYDLLKVGGLLEVGNFTKFPIGFFADCASGWKLIIRSPEDMLGIASKEMNSSYEFVADQTFLLVRKTTQV